MKKLSRASRPLLNDISVSNSKSVTAMSQPEKVVFEEAWQFIIKVGLAAHKYGSTASRIESLLKFLAGRLGYQGVFRSNPSEIIFALRESPESPQRLEIIEAYNDLNLDKLAHVGDLIQQFKTGRLSIAEASKQLDSIDNIKPAWRSTQIMFSYALVGFGIPAILGGGWWDTLYATLLSFIVYFVVSISARLGSTAMQWMPVSAAFVAAVLATLLKLWIPELNIVLVVLSATAIILPGYTISLGLGELITQHIISGMTNLINGLFCMLKLIFGGWLGVLIVSKIFTHDIAFPHATPIDHYWLFLMFPSLMLGLCVVFQTPKRDLLWTMLLSAIAYIMIIIGSHLVDSNLGNLLGTIISVMLANLWARYHGRPSSIVLIPAIVFLVSGSIGFRGLAAMASGELLIGSQQFLQMFAVAITITVGILIGHALVKPENNL